MVRLKPWQWIALAAPIATIVIFLLVAAGIQIHEWHLNWIWAVFTLIFVGWRWLLVKWTQPAIAQMEAVVAQVTKDLESASQTNLELSPGNGTDRAKTALEQVLQASRSDRPVWEDWAIFWQRCQDLVASIAQIYHPEVKYPLLNIYVPQAYSLIRGTVDDLDNWMQKLSPALNQVTIAQAYQAYEVYRKLEPSARKVLKVWNYAQWVFNPAVALARQASQRYNTEANQQLLGNFSQLLREAALRNLSRQAIALYSGNTLPSAFNKTTSQATVTAVRTQSLKEILSQAQPTDIVAQKPVNIVLVGRTGAGKSSTINTLFRSELATVDVLPSTNRLESYHWSSETGDNLTLWDAPGYEQVNREDLRDLVLDYTSEADLILLVTPALDPALQMDVDFLEAVKAEISDLPIITVVTQVDRLRPIREWNPPYDWVLGERPKEKAIREALQYRSELLGEWCDSAIGRSATRNRILPLVAADAKTNRIGWGVEELSLALVQAISPAKQLRLARFLRDLEARSLAATQIIDRYSFQMTTTQGITALLKSPVLQFISTMSTGSPSLAAVLAQSIPVEQLPLVIGKLQMAYDLYSLLNTNSQAIAFDLPKLWSVLTDNSGTPEQNAWAFGQALVEYWGQNLTGEQLPKLFLDKFNQVL
ncbi:GTPase family protein [Merismopedia glauca]|uniref:GTPase n=1 Tax=Merismopedia glauca CCAP 1448/3 TaxID=1296344 RepID=A0A2T1C7Z0_9CYAN|nr:GTPase family protein [Merismopedia glauca]PSB04392.1 GTPase [Merismopedia glauca CCAP 1448/3]